MQAADGNFYGTTYFGNYGGTAFRLTPTGSLTTFYKFFSTSYTEVGVRPSTGLTLGLDGVFYGSTFESSEGGLYTLTTGGSATPIRVEFRYLAGSPDIPRTQFTRAGDGSFYTAGLYTVYRVRADGSIVFSTPIDYATVGSEVLGALSAGADGDFSHAGRRAQCGSCL